MAGSRPCRDRRASGRCSSQKAHAASLAWHPNQNGPPGGSPAEPSRNGSDEDDLRLGEIELDADAVGIMEEELRIAGARHDAFAEFHAAGLQAFAHALDIGGGEGDVV